MLILYILTYYYFLIYNQKIPFTKELRSSCVVQKNKNIFFRNNISSNLYIFAIF